MSENACKNRLSPHVAPYDSYSILGPSCANALAIRSSAILAVLRSASESARPIEGLCGSLPGPFDMKSTLFPRDLSVD